MRRDGRFVQSIDHRLPPTDMAASPDFLSAALKQPRSFVGMNVAHIGIAEVDEPGEGPSATTSLDQQVIGRQVAVQWHLRLSAQQFISHLGEQGGQGRAVGLAAGGLGHGGRRRGRSGGRAGGGAGGKESRGGGRV